MSGNKNKDENELKTIRILSNAVLVICLPEHFLSFISPKESKSEDPQIIVINIWYGKLLKKLLNEIYLT